MAKTWRFLLLLLSAIGISFLLTQGMIRAGLDWDWAVFFNTHDLFVVLSVPFVLIGMAVPLGLVLYGWYQWKGRKRADYEAYGKRATFSFLLAYCSMSLLKVFTNRVDMEPFEPIGAIDFSDQFRYGFMNSNHWWESLSEGWPSGHTMIAIAMAIAIHPNLHSRFWRRLNIVYPILISLSVSTSFHWLSDVISGALIGSLIGFSARRFFPEPGPPR